MGDGEGVAFILCGVRRRRRHQLWTRTTAAIFKRPLVRRRCCRHGSEFGVELRHDGDLNLAPGTARRPGELMLVIFGKLFIGIASLAATVLAVRSERLNSLPLDRKSTRLNSSHR